MARLNSSIVHGDLTVTGKVVADGTELTGGTGGSGGGGSGLLLLIPSNVQLDDTNVGSDGGNVWGITESIDFSNSQDGSIWATMEFPDTLDDTSDIQMDIIYSLNGSDDSTNVRLQIDYWLYGTSETPSSGSPTGTNTDDITVGVGTDGTKLRTSLSNLPNASISDSDTLTLKVTRLAENVNDTYSGTFQMIYIYLYQ